MLQLGEAILGEFGEAAKNSNCAIDPHAEAHSFCDCPPEDAGSFS